MRILNRLRQFRRRRRIESDLADEVRIHIEMAEERLRESGATEEEARQKARQRFGNAGLAIEESRGVWSFVWIDELTQDLRYAARAWMRNPGFAATVIVTIGLALGLNTALFTAFDHYVLRPLAVRDPDSLHHVEWTTKSGGGHPFTWDEYQQLSEQKHILSGSYAWFPALRQLDGQTAYGQLVTPDFFEMLGARTALGRPFTPADASAAGEGAYAVLSHNCWTSRYGSDPLIVGRKVFVRGHPFEVIGVAAPEFTGIGPAPADFWVPMTMFAALNNGVNVFEPGRTGMLMAVIRLRPDVPLEAAKTALLDWSRELTRNYPDDRRAIGIYTEPRSSAVPLNGAVLLAFAPIFVAFGLVLLTACANVSNMMLARAVMRQREIGVRISLGAGRLRLVRQLLAESFLLAASAALAGLLISELTMRVIREIYYRTIPEQIGRVIQVPEMHPDYRVFGFVALAATATTLLFGLLPALQATRSGVAYAIRGDLGSNVRPSRLRSALVVAQVMICAVMLITSFILLRTESRIAQRDVRMDATGVLEVRVPSKSALRLADLLAQETTAQEIAAVLRAPLYGGFPSIGIAPAGEKREVRSFFNMVSPEYFAMLGIPVISGRNFTRDEARIHAPVVVVSEATARRLWPNESPLGKEIRIQADQLSRHVSSPAFSRAQVVGVARDVVNGPATEAVDSACVYFPLAAGHEAVNALLVRVRGDVHNTRLRIERLMQERAPGIADLIVPLEEMGRAMVYPVRVVFWVGSALAALALVLVISGTYGVLSFLLSQRRKELGIRIALGASQSNVVGLILRQSMRLAVTGIAIGTTVTLALARVVANRIDTLRPFEPLPYAVAIGLVLAAAAAAAFVPSLRAARLDPATTLRND